MLTLRPTNPTVADAEQARASLARGDYFMPIAPSVPALHLKTRRARQLRAAGYCTVRVEIAPGRQAIINLECLAHA